MDQISVLVNFVTVPARYFSKTELTVHFKERLGGSPAGGKLELFLGAHSEATQCELAGLPLVAWDFLE